MAERQKMFDCQADKDVQQSEYIEDKISKIIVEDRGKSMMEEMF